MILQGFFWRLDVWWNLDASVDVKMVTWRWDRNFIFPVLVLSYLSVTADLF
jgi:hypothetical protein